MSDFRDPAVSAAFEELRREIARDFEEHPERWIPQERPALAASVRSLHRVTRLLEQHRDSEALEEMARFVRLSRLERGETVIPFPSRPSRPNSSPPDLPTAA